MRSKIFLFILFLLCAISFWSCLPQTPSFSSDALSIAKTVHKVQKTTFYLSSGVAFGTIALLTKLSGEFCQISPWTAPFGQDCLLLNEICSSLARRSFTTPFKKFPPSCYNSWELNKKQLRKIPFSSQEEEQLLLFLEKRWLAKTTGFYSFFIDWICPCFGIDVQIHPETTNSYARDPSNKFSKTYLNIMEAWKKKLPQPKEYPLILTRPSDLTQYLPKSVVDVTSIFPEEMQDPKQWLCVWEKHPSHHSLKQDQTIYIQRLKQQEIGGIRVLPLKGTPPEKIEYNHQLLLEWISKFGLTANRVELDRFSTECNRPQPTFQERSPCSIPSKEEFASSVDSFHRLWTSTHPQKDLLFQGTIQIIKGLFSKITEEKWNAILACPTRGSIIQSCCANIQKELNLLIQETQNSSFFEMASRIEQIHSHLSPLLEMTSPFEMNDFPAIYHDLLHSTPSALKPFTQYAVHSTGMTSLAGILKAVEETTGLTPRVLYGENLYFEIIKVAELSCNATSIEEATEEDWKKVDLILAQFNPVLKRIDFEVTEYQLEKVAENMRTALDAREGKPLTLALDCTLDFIDSPRVKALLNSFQKEIKTGALNIICYRSGLKFDLFGMDNYCGAPLYMIHNQDPQWKCFNTLITDPVLLTDRLSLNWFCLAYHYAAPQLEEYRKQIFNNTRALLNKIPPQMLYQTDLRYKVIPAIPDADLAFLDIKVFGPLHKIKAGLVGGFLSVKCMQKKHPIFYRPSLGFYHPNLSILFGKDCSTIRLTLGLDPEQIDILANCFEKINNANL